MTDDEFDFFLHTGPRLRDGDGDTNELMAFSYKREMRRVKMRLKGNK